MSKRNKLNAPKKQAGSYSAKIAAGHVPLKHSRFPKFGE